MTEMMSNDELDAKMEEADKKLKRSALSQEDREKYGKQILTVVNEKAPLIKWEIVEAPEGFDDYVQEGNRKVKENNIYVRGSFIHPEKGELAAISVVPTGLGLTNELAEDVARRFENDRKRKLL